MSLPYIIPTFIFVFNNFVTYHVYDAYAHAYTTCIFITRTRRFVYITLYFICCFFTLRYYTGFAE